MRLPLDLGGFEILLATSVLILGTIAVCVFLALAARAVDRVWDVLSPER
jgi:hypothetical protein